MNQKEVLIPIYVGIGIDGITPHTHVLRFTPEPELPKHPIHCFDLFRAIQKSIVYKNATARQNRSKESSTDPRNFETGKTKKK